MNHRNPCLPAFILPALVLMLTLADRGNSQTTAPAAPTEKTEVRDLTKPPARTLTSSISIYHPGWDEQRQRANGPAVYIRFSGPAAPLDQVGKAVPAGAIRMTPEVAGEWQWQRQDQLVFFPTNGWLPPASYRFEPGEGLLSEDCKLKAKTAFDHAWTAPPLTARFHNRNYYIDPATPTLQQLVTTVDFSLPVSLEEVRRHFSVTSVTGIGIFQPGSKAQVLPDPKTPMRFYLRSPLMKPGEKEDLVLFSFKVGLKALTGGNPTANNLETKLTAYSKGSAFFIESAGRMLRRTADGEPEQSIFVQLSIPANTALVAPAVEAWKLPEELKDKNQRAIAWTKENVTDEVLARSHKLSLERITHADSPPMETIIAFRVPSQPGGKVFVKVPKDTSGPGGFVTAEDFRDVTTLPEIPKEAALMGNGGLMALNGERKLNVQSRGLDHLRYTVARVQTNQINHLVSQTRGSFESPHFRSGFGFENISNYQQSVQPIVKSGDYSINYSSFDFSPLLQAAQPGAAPTHGLFHLTLEGVRPRTPDDGAAEDGAPDKDWIAIPSGRSSGDYSYRQPSGSSYPLGDQTRDQRFILVTDLGLIMKESADGSRSVYVLSFSTQGPVQGVEISVLSKNGTVLKNVTTNDFGMAGIPSLRGLQREQEPVAVVAKKGDDLAFIPWAKNDRHLDTSRFDVGGVAYSEESVLEASLFTERGIYRPGEAINIGGIVRQRDWSGDLTGLPLELVVYNAKEDVAGRYSLNLEAGGVFSKTIPTAETAPTGPWRVQLVRPKPADAAARVGSVYLGGVIVRVEEFQPDRQKIKATFQPGASDGWRSPDGLQVAVQLDTLFGIPAAKRRVAGKLFLSPTTPSFAKWPGWQFGIPDSKRFVTKQIPLADATTDENGHTTLPLNLEAHTAPMLRARVELEGFEADDGRGVRTELSTLVSRQRYLIGHKTPRNLHYLDGRDPVSVGVVAIGPDSKPVAVADLTRVLVQTKHVSILTKQKNGNLAYQSNSRDETLETVTVSLPAQEDKLALPLDNPGRFRYEFRNAQGQTLCSIPFFVAGKGDAAKDLERSGELGIKFADKKWLPGEELEFSLTTPFAGAGLITIERDKVLAQTWFKCDTKSSVQKIRLPDHFAGGAYLHVVMARALDSPDVFLNPLASGIMPIAAARGNREMAVTLESPDRVRPGQRLAIGYTAPQEGHMLIWAVDEGIHLVSNYQAPDPLHDLLPRARLEVETYQLMDVLLPEFSLLRKAMAIGGDGEEGESASIPTLKLGLNPFKRRRDAPVIYWSGFVPCGPERKEVIYQVPEYFAGRLKIMAVAVAPDAVGVGQAASIVKGDFVLTSTTPLFVVPGDEFTASVTVANQLEGAGATDQVKVQVESQGGVEIIDRAPETQTIPVGKETTVSYRCRATDLLGNAELKFTASSGESRQVSSSSFSVRPGVARAAKVQSGWFRNGSHDLATNHPMFHEFSERQAIISTTPLGLAHGLAAFLKEYPHGCTEQIVSRAYPWLVLKDDANFGIDKAEAARSIADTMNQLSRRQGRNGGFGYWGSNEQDGFDYLTVYVGHFLTDCKASGFPVPARLYQATLRRLRFMADAKITDPTKHNGRTYYWRTRWEAEMRASAIYLLTRNEEVTTNYALKLQDYLDAKVPKEIWHRDSTAAWLASTWRLLKKESAAVPLIEAHRAALKRPRPDNWEYGYYYYTSKLANEATAFTILCRHFPEMAKKLTYGEMRPLTQMIEAADFHTLSAAWSIQALKAYSDLAASNGVKAGIASVQGKDVKVLAEPATGQLQVKVPEGMTRFFFAENSPEGLGAWYQTIEKGFAKNLPEKASSTHIEVLRELVNADGQAVTQGKLGETLFATLTIRNLTKTEMPNLAITEMLPGGFEFAPPGEPDSLRPGLATRQGTDYVDIREDRALIYLGLRAEGSLTLKYALRPTCAGTFLVPPPYAEDMYEAKVRANGAGGKILIQPRQ
ncbi:MAG: alpha-2-macroglobulin family protein [Akkermansiaceae bacterium]|nr:alpha-2-macroglobulin family protein [Akkermansiaceae bacterium]